MNIKPTTAWAWAIMENGEYVLCHYCFATKALLLYDGKPSPEAKAVKVQMKVAKKSKRRIK